MTPVRPARGLWLAYLLAGTAAIIVYYLWPSPVVQTVVALGVTAGAFGALLAGVRMHRPARRLPWLLLTVGQTAAFACWTVWQYGILAHGDAPESGSIVDVFWVVNLLGVLGAIVLLMRSRDPGNAAMLDSGIVACALALVASIVLLAPAVETQSGAGLAAFLAYAALDTAMLAVVARLVLRGTVWVPAGALLLGGVLALLSTDVAYTWLGAAGSYTPGAWADLGWLFFPALVGAAALHPSMASLFDTRVRRDDKLSTAHLLVLAAALLVVPGVIAVDILSEREIAMPLVLVLTAALSLLVLSRLAGLVRQGDFLRRSLADQNRELRDRTAAVELLREIAEATDGSSSTDEALARAIEAICGATGWPIGHAHVKERGFPQLTPTRIWHLDDAERWEPFVRLSESLHFVAGHGLPGRVLESGRPARFSFYEGDREAPRAETARQVGIRAGFAFPILVEGEVAAVLEFFSPESIDDDPSIDELSVAAGNQLARVIERAHAEAALRASEERFRRLVANVPGAIYRTSIENGRTVEYVSEHIEQIIGHPAEDFVSGRVSPLTVIHPDDAAWVDAAVQDALERSAAIDLEYRMVHADGTVRWVAETARPVRDAATGQSFFDGVIVDMTERRHADEELRRLALIVESSGDAIFGLTLEGTVTTWNAAAEQLTGYPADEIIGRHISHVLPEEHRDGLTRVAERVLGGERVGAYETQLLKRCGGRAEISLSAGLISGEAGVAVTVRDITAAKEAERRLREAENRYRILVEQLPLATYIDEPDERGGSTYLSPQIEQIVGYAPSEWLADRELFKKVLHPEDRDRVLAEVRRATAADEPVSQEYRVVAKDGRTVWLRDSAVVVRDEGGKPIYRQGYVIDTTEQQATQALLRETEERYRVLVEQLPVITYIDLPGDPDGDLWLPYYVSSQLEPMLGWSREEWMSYPDFYFDHIVHPEDRDAVLRAHDVALAAQAGFTIEHRLLHRDGSVRWYVDHLVIAREDEGRPLWAQGYLLDITARKEAEDRLREAETRYAAIVESSDDAILGLTTEGVITSWNAGAERLYGFTAEEMIGKHAGTLIPEELRELEREAIHTTLGSGKHLRQYETERLRRDGTRVPISLTVSPIKDAAGNRTGAAGIARDITEQKRAKAELERLLERERAQNAELRTLDTMKDEFIALVSHELRTPLTSIRGYLELVLEASTDELSEEQRQFISVAQRNADRLQSLVGDLLFIAQIEAGRLALERGKVDLVDVARESVESGGPLASAKEIELTLVTRPVGAMIGDRGRLGQLLDNFVSNAVKFTPEGGRVEVRLSASDSGTAVLEVADNGMGIPVDEQEHLFERFFRSSTATAQAIQGTGLGLTISKAIAEAHGGRITFTSVQNEGTTFRIELPLAGQLQEAA